MVATEGGVDVEAVGRDGLRTGLAHPEQLAEAAKNVCAGLPSPFGETLQDASARLAKDFWDHEASLLEINPLFILR